MKRKEKYPISSVKLRKIDSVMKKRASTVVQVLDVSNVYTAKHVILVIAVWYDLRYDGRSEKQPLKPPVLVC